MTSVIEYYSDTIITKSRGFLEFATFGNWGRICTLDLTRQTLEVTTFRLVKTHTRSHSLHDFDAVDYTYKCLSRIVRDGVEHERDEFRVGLRFRNSTEVVPIAVFHGSTSTPVGLGAFIASFFPDSWMAGTGGTQDVASRSLANMLCLKLCLKLAM